MESGCKLTLVEKANITADSSELEILNRNPDFEILDKYDLTENVWTGQSRGGKGMIYTGPKIESRIRTLVLNFSEIYIQT